MTPTKDLDAFIEGSLTAEQFGQRVLAEQQRVEQLAQLQDVIDGYQYYDSMEAATELREAAAADPDNAVVYEAASNHLSATGCSSRARGSRGATPAHRRASTDDEPPLQAQTNTATLRASAVPQLSPPATSRDRGSRAVRGIARRPSAVMAAFVTVGRQGSAPALMGHCLTQCDAWRSNVCALHRTRSTRMTHLASDAAPIQRGGYSWPRHQASDSIGSGKSGSSGSRPSVSSRSSHSSRSEGGSFVPHQGQYSIPTIDEPPSWTINPYSRTLGQ
jgi:hypothetical protein